MSILPDRNELTTPADGDLYMTTDVSDASDAVTGTDKKITWANIKAALKTYFNSVTQILTNKTIDVDNNTIQNAGNLILARIAGSTYSTVQHLQDVFHSAGVAEGGSITDDADGTITVALGNGFIRATDSAVAEILYFDWVAEAGAAVALTDSDMNYIYVEYNAGSPQIIATVSKRTDENTNIFLGTVYREGTDLHITEATRANVGDHAIKMLIRMRETMPFQRVSGGIISELGTRNIAVTAGDWWEGLTNFITAAIDSSVSDTFTRCYSDGAGGFTTELAQTQWNNTQYDDGTGTLATLSNNKYGVHWLYLAQDGALFVLYGGTDGTLTEANDAGVPANTPPQFDENHARLIGKIVFLKSAATVTSIQSVFNGQFSLEAASDHGGLTGLGDDDHSQYSLISSQAGAPSSTPTRAGEINIDSTNNNIYISTGNSSSSDWRLHYRSGQNMTDVQEIRVDAIPDTDETATGLTTDTINAGAIVAKFESVYAGSGGKWLLTDASVTATADKLLAIALEAGTDTNPLLVALPGSFIRDDTWTWTVGGAIYLSETAGALTQTAPTAVTDAVVRVVGYAISADVMFFNPETGVVLA